MRKQIVLTLSGIFITSLLLQGQDSLKTHLLNEAVVTGTKFEIPAEKSGKVIFKIGSEKLQTRLNLADVLNEVPGVQMDGNFGTPGTNVSYYVRGGRSRHSLILLDGVPMNDPSGIDPFFDLRFISTDQLDNVEVLQGGLSTLYGSGAAASVINIQTKNANEDGIHGGVGLQAGSWKSFGQNLNLNGRQGKLSFQLLGSNFKSTGFSAALDNDDAVEYDDDGFERRNGLLKVGYQFTQSFKVDLFGSVDWFDSEYDNGAFADGNNTLTQKQGRIGTKLTKDYAKGYFSLTAQYTSINRDLQSSFPAEYDGGNWFGEVINKHEINSSLTLLSGISFQKLEYSEEFVSKDTTSFTIVDPYTSLLFSTQSGLNIHAGVRVNNHSEYGSKLIYNINPSWLFSVNEQIKLKPFASVSTSFITPTLFQLHTPYGGNIDLDPEESLNKEYGLSILTSDKLVFTFVNFFREEKNVIGYIYQYENISEHRKVKGVTVDAQFKPFELLTLTGDFSWVTSDDKQSFYRIPERKAGVGVQVKPMKGSSISLHYQYTGSRTDLYFDEFFNANEVELDAYNLIDVSLTQSLLKNRMLISGSVLNLTDEDFVGVYGYTTRGINFSLGVKYSF